MDSHAPDQDLAAIRSLVADAEKLQNDLDGYLNLLTRDMAIVNIMGRRVSGWDNIYAAYKQALESSKADIHTRHELEDVRFLRPDVALASIIKHVSDDREPSAQQHDRTLPSRARLTFVVVKERIQEESRWLIASAQTTPIAS
jgi:uncharacterized protein (TIGR02246 family)